MGHLFLMAISLLYGTLLIRNPNTGVQELKHYPWTYHGDSGPLHWYKNFFHCGGRRQSPINIMTSEVEPVTWLTNFYFNGYNKVSSHGTSSFITMQNNGHTASMPIQENIFIEGSNLRDSFRLAEIHFHWGEDNTKGSEHHVDGVIYPMEIHFVHFNTKYGNLSKAMIQPDGLAVIGVFVEISLEDNFAFEHIVEAVDQVTQYNAKTKVSGVRAMDLLPRDTSKYFHYLGSLTTPPCYESVLWYVMADKYKVSQRQINVFKRLRQIPHHGNSSKPSHSRSGLKQKSNLHNHSHKNGSKLYAKDKYILNNFRPIQPLNRRTVFCSHSSLRTITTASSIPYNYQGIYDLGYQAPISQSSSISSKHRALANAFAQSSFGRRLNNKNENKFLNRVTNATKATRQPINTNALNKVNKMEIRFGADFGLDKKKIELFKSTSSLPSSRTTYSGVRTTKSSPLSILDKTTNSYSLFSDNFLHGKYKIDKDALLKVFASLILQQSKQLASSYQLNPLLVSSGVREFSNPATGVAPLKQSQKHIHANRFTHSQTKATQPSTTVTTNQTLLITTQIPISTNNTGRGAIATTSNPVTNNSLSTGNLTTTTPSPTTQKPVWVDPKPHQTVLNVDLNITVNGPQQTTVHALSTQQQFFIQQNSPQIQNLNLSKPSPSLVTGTSAFPTERSAWVDPQHLAATTRHNATVKNNMQIVGNLQPTKPHVQPLQNSMHGQSMAPQKPSSSLSVSSTASSGITPWQDPQRFHTNPVSSVNNPLLNNQQTNGLLSKVQQQLPVQHTSPQVQNTMTLQPSSPVNTGSPILHTQGQQNTNLNSFPSVSSSMMNAVPQIHQQNVQLQSPTHQQMPVNQNLNLVQGNEPVSYLNPGLPAVPTQPPVLTDNRHVPSGSTSKPQSVQTMTALEPLVPFEQPLRQIQNAHINQPAAHVASTANPLSNIQNIQSANINNALNQPAIQMTPQPVQTNNIAQGRNPNIRAFGGATNNAFEMVTQAFESHHIDTRVPILNKQNNQLVQTRSQHLANPQSSKIIYPQTVSSNFGNFIENHNPNNEMPLKESGFHFPGKSDFHATDRPDRWEISTVPPTLGIQGWKSSGPSTVSPTPDPKPPRDFVHQHHLSAFYKMDNLQGQMISNLTPRPRETSTVSSWLPMNSDTSVSQMAGDRSLSMMGNFYRLPDGVAASHWRVDQKGPNKKDRRDRPDM